MSAPSIGYFIQGGYTVSATCNGCRRSKPLDLVALAVAHGEDAVLVDLAKRFRCQCGHRGAGLSVAPGPGTVGYARDHR